MYFDNITKFASDSAEDLNITYGEIMEGTLQCAEVQAAGEMFLMQQEATAHILGSEGPSDWWAKIKTVARKIFEAIKTLAAKVFAFIKSVPSKLANLVKRILIAWEKSGLKKKVEAAQSKNALKEDPFKLLQARDFGVELTNKMKTALATYTKAVETFNTDVANISSKDYERDEFTEKLADARATYEKAKLAFTEAENTEKAKEAKPFALCKTAADVLKVINLYYKEVKNNTYVKKCSSAQKTAESNIRINAVEVKKAMAGLEKAEREDDENAARSIISACTAHRQGISINAWLSQKSFAYAYSDTLRAAKIVNAGLAVLKKVDDTEKETETDTKK